MAILSVFSYRVHPGKAAEFIEFARESKAIIESLGVNLRHIRLVHESVAGTDSGIYRIVMEYDDLGSWAATIEREEQDPRFLDTRRRATQAAPATLVGRALLSQIGGEAGQGGTSTVAEINAARLKPGRMDDLLRGIERINAAVATYNIVSLRHFAITVAGPNVGLVFAAAEFADIPMLAAARQRDQDQAFQSAVAELIGPDGPIVPTSTSIQTVVPL